MKLAVYGTLKRGFGNHILLEDSELVFRGYTKIPFKMVSNGGIPWLVPTEERHKIYIEVYKVTEEKLETVDRLESAYERKQIYIEEIGTPAFIYVMPNAHEGKPVKDGKFRGNWELWK